MAVEVLVAVKAVEVLEFVKVIEGSEVPVFIEVDYLREGS